MGGLGERKMAKSEERMKILKLIQEGKISIEEGSRLIEALDQPARTVLPPEPKGIPEPPPMPAMGVNRGARWFRVRVTDTLSGKVRVNVRLPVNLVNAGLKMGARFSPEVQGLDQEQLVNFINSGEVGKLVDVYDDQDNEHVEVFIE
jgi:hypothetical protein